MKSEKIDTAEKVSDLTKQLEDGVKQIFQDGEYEKFLKMVSALPRHSINNNLLIYMQNPEATYVAGFKKWQELGRHVKKGEKGIKILAPMTYKKEVESKSHEEQKEEVIIVGFKPVYVFDVAQTEGEPLVMLPHRLEANVHNFEKIMEALRNISPFPISIEPILNGANGYCSWSENKIVIRENLSEAHSVKTAIHEIAHAILHVNNNQETSRETKEIEAESVAYIVTNYYGIDSSDYSFAYVAGWAADEKLTQLQQSIKTIQESASKIINELDAAFHELGLEFFEEKEVVTVKEKLKSAKEKVKDEKVLNKDINKEKSFEVCR